MTKLKIVPLEEKFAKECEAIESSLLSKTNLDKILKTIQSDVLHYFVLLDEEKVIGFYECQIILPEAELYDIAIKKEEQGKGFSYLLMNHFIEFCKENGCDTIFLEVNRINQKAINLYHKFGFVVYSKRQNYYGENDAILMKLSLWNWQNLYYEIFKIWGFKKIYSFSSWLGCR